MIIKLKGKKSGDRGKIPSPPIGNSQISSNGINAQSHKTVQNSTPITSSVPPKVSWNLTATTVRVLCLSIFLNPFIVLLLFIIIILVLLCFWLILPMRLFSSPSSPIYLFISSPICLSYIFSFLFFSLFSFFPSHSISSPSPPIYLFSRSLRPLLPLLILSLLILLLSPRSHSLCSVFLFFIPPFISLLFLCRRELLLTCTYQLIL